MDCFSEIFKKLFSRRMPRPPRYQRQVDYSKLRTVILGHYVAYLAEMSEEELPDILLEESYDWVEFRVSTAELSASCVQELRKYMSMVPRLKDPPQGQHFINKYRPVKEVIGFLVRLLYHKTGLITDSCKDQIDNLEKDLRFLLTVLGDTSLMVCVDEDEEFSNLLSEFEAVAKEAGSLVHSLLFPTDGEIDDGIAVVLKDMGILKANIMKLSDVVQRKSTYMSAKTSLLDSLLVLDSLVSDLEDLMNSDDDSPIADVNDQIQTLLQGMISLQSFIKNAGPEIGEFCMRSGDLARQARYHVVSFLAGDAPRWYLVSRLNDVNQGIEELCRTEVPNLTMKYSSGGSKAAERVNKELSSSLSKSNAETDEVIVGFEEKTHIIDQLVGGGAALLLVSIFGMSGLGKTTLARKLYNHPSVNSRFDKASWCVVSQTYSRYNVLANILIQISELGKDRILEMEEETLVTHIYKTLKNRRYLIVMDDVWGRDVWDEFLRCFPDDGNGSRILFTTRNKEVAPPNCVLYALPSLSDDQCWELLQKKVFDNQPCPSELVESGREIAKSCGGLPLAVVVIAGVLSTADKEAEEWEEVRRNLSSYILEGRDNTIMRILKLSYDHLPQHLKPCFLYLGVYPEDQEIPARDVMNLWIAEGFVHNENEKNAAEVYLKELIDKSLVMVAKRRSDGGPKTCLVHDLLRDLCLKTCDEEMLTRFLYDKYFKNDEDRAKVAMDSAAWICCQYMRYHFGGRRRDYIIDVPDMRLLRVLYFDINFIYLAGIEYLVCLKYLVIGDLPPSISNLVNLEYLRVETDDKTEYLSSPIMKMKKLKHMKLPSGVTYGEDCSTSEMSKLEFLSYVVIRNVRDEEMLKCSPHLRRLKCFYAKRVRKMINLSFFTQLESLTLAFSKTLYRVEMTLPSSIKKLALVGLKNKLSTKTMFMIGGLENLEVLKLMGIEFDGNRWDTRDGEFQKLRYLRMDHTRGLKRWNVESSQCFPKLQHLVLHECFHVWEIPVEIGEIPTLQMIEVEGPGVEESARRIQQEQRDMGNEELRVIRSDSSRRNPSKLVAQGQLQLLKFGEMLARSNIPTSEIHRMQPQVSELLKLTISCFSSISFKPHKF